MPDMQTFACGIKPAIGTLLTRSQNGIQRIEIRALMDKSALCNNIQKSDLYWVIIHTALFLKRFMVANGYGFANDFSQII
jgi:hypothetical protein